MKIKNKIVSYAGKNNRFIKVVYHFLPTLILLCSSCSVYHIPMESFKEQFGFNDTIIKMQTTYALKLKKITCLDSKGRIIEIKNEPSVEIKFEQLNGKKTVLFFRSIYVTDSTVCGFDDHYLKAVSKCIPLNTITFIQIKNSKKGLNNPNLRPVTSY